MGSESQQEGSVGRLEGSEGQLEGSEGQQEGSEGQLEVFEDLVEGSNTQERPTSNQGIKRICLSVWVRIDQMYLEMLCNKSRMQKVIEAKSGHTKQYRSYSHQISSCSQ